MNSRSTSGANKKAVKRPAANTLSVICCNDSNLLYDKMLMSHVYIVIVLVICCNNFLSDYLFLSETVTCATILTRVIYL